MGTTVTGPEVNLDTPRIAELTVKRCVEDASFMRGNHMELLGDWKDAVVRRGFRDYLSRDGHLFSMSLQNTCLDCHSNKAEFCDACHSFGGAKTNGCFNCHLEPKGVSQ
ncbi:MAG: sulfate reduction electron transfer complex DsrMKJOP subunit DsrJ [Clostridia bacterium]|nr:sulfate reduction electron transfer complex DsrMKJOP subunit DsrJ [Clostridia bacterium]